MTWPKTYAAPTNGSPRDLRGPGQSPLDTVSVDRKWIS